MENEISNLIASSSEELLTKADQMQGTTQESASAIQQMAEGAQQQELAGDTPILLTSGILRSVLAKFIKYTIPGLRVISYQEIPDDKQIKIVSAIGQ